MFHKSLSCRICAEMMHSRGDCHTIDLYDPEQIENLVEEEEEAEGSKPMTKLT